jgi:hypothetical protein
MVLSTGEVSTSKANATGLLLGGDELAGLGGWELTALGGWELGGLEGELLAGGLLLAGTELTGPELAGIELAGTLAFELGAGPTELGELLGAIEGILLGAEETDEEGFGALAFWLSSTTAVQSPFEE